MPGHACAGVVMHTHTANETTKTRNKARMPCVFAAICLHRVKNINYLKPKNCIVQTTAYQVVSQPLRLAHALCKAFLSVPQLA
jgi:hypothetical protein